jgi:hypothetical protein
VQTHQTPDGSNLIVGSLQEHQNENCWSTVSSSRFGLARFGFA